MTQSKTETRDGMVIEWDAAVPMDDGVVLRADVFRPVAAGRYPAILSYGPYAKGLAFQEGYKSAWLRMTESFPESAEGSTNQYQNWELVDPEKWVPDGYAVVRGYLRRRPPPGHSKCGRRARRISTLASSGPARKAGATARSASTASPITP